MYKKLLSYFILFNSLQSTCVAFYKYQVMNKSLTNYKKPYLTLAKLNEFSTFLNEIIDHNLDVILNSGDINFCGVYIQTSRNKLSLISKQSISNINTYLPPTINNVNLNDDDNIDLFSEANYQKYVLKNIYDNTVIGILIAYKKYGNLWSNKDINLIEKIGYILTKYIIHHQNLDYNVIVYTYIYI